ncbi:MAG: hypothetical protein LLG04_16145 [Parachlamydia sp.]|nr:hypothetical protein [Parachlamydia sp.]
MQLSTINGFSTLRNDQVGIQYHIAPGMPDPAQECTEECALGKDKRRRVKRESSETSLCFYFASMTIRRFIGPTFCPSLKRFQPFETALVEMQKKIADYEASIASCNQMLWTESAETLKKIDKQEAQCWIVNLQNFSSSEAYREMVRANYQQIGKPFDVASMLKRAPAQIVLFKDFMAQDKHQNLYDYCFNLKCGPRIKILLSFLTAIGKNPEEIKTELRVCCPPQMLVDFSKIENLATMPVDFVEPLQAMVQLLAMHHFDLKIVLWKPAEPFSVLQNALKQSGPICVGGKIGHSFYDIDPTKLNEKWGEKSVYGWTPGAARKKSFVKHAITIIGSVKGPDHAGGGYIYFLDPLDVSDPNAPTLEKIYKIAYKNLVANAEPIGYFDGRVIGYAWHRKEINS